MKFEIYCDESRQDLFWSKASKSGKYLLIGGLWLPGDLRNDVKEHVRVLKEQYNVYGEIKWQKVSASHLDFYLDLVDLFLAFGSNLRFRCIAIEAAKVDMVRYHDADQELGFYKFYYQLIHHWILDFNDYIIFCDVKTNRRGDRLRTLQRCLDRANLSSTITSVQAIPSHESTLIQLTDFLLGATGARLNNSIISMGAKEQVIRRLEQSLGVEKLHHTPKAAQKFNIFIIDLGGGW